MARVARPAGQRGRTIPAARAADAPGRGDARLQPSSSIPWTLGPGARHRAESAVRGESGQVRRTAAIIAAGALVFLAGCSGDDSSKSGSDGAAAPDAQVSLALADGSAGVSPVAPLEIAVTDGDLGDVTLVDGDGTTVTGAVADSPDQEDTVVWTPDTPLDYGTSY